MNKEEKGKKEAEKLSQDERLKKEIEDARRQGKSEAWIRMNLDV